MHRHNPARARVRVAAYSKRRQRRSIVPNAPAKGMTGKLAGVRLRVERRRPLCLATREECSLTVPELLSDGSGIPTPCSRLLKQVRRAGEGGLELCSDATEPVMQSAAGRLGSSCFGHGWKRLCPQCLVSQLIMRHESEKARDLDTLLELQGPSAQLSGYGSAT